MLPETMSAIEDLLNLGGTNYMENGCFWPTLTARIRPPDSVAVDTSTSAQ